MKINSASKSNKKLAVIVTVLALVLIGGYGAYAAVNHAWPFPAAEDDNTAQNQAADTPNIQTDPSIAPGEPAPSTPDSPKTPQESEPSEDTPAKGSVGVTITAVNNYDGFLQVRSLIENVSGNGSCTLTLKKGSKTVTKTSGIQALPSSSTCKGFNVPVSELSPGSWSITLNVTTDGKTGSATKEYEVTK